MCKFYFQKLATFARPNLGRCKRDALKKKDMVKKSGEGAVHFSDVDEMVFDVLGRESAVVEGLDVRDTEEDVEFLSDSPASSAAAVALPIKSEIKPASLLLKTPKAVPRQPKVRDREYPAEEADLDLEIKRAKLAFINDERQLKRTQIEGQMLANEKLRREMGTTTAAAVVSGGAFKLSHPSSGFSANFDQQLSIGYSNQFPKTAALEEIHYTSRDDEFQRLRELEDEAFERNAADKQQKQF
ncbi:hypothetical protein niasHT_031390 [Heterodera trifolii]|uniref:Uncharacterized protein n=1 Tax=Heterodera trifolii TaxID=157864 RepID=A0ABD2J0G6_9BILA